MATWTINELDVPAITFFIGEGFGQPINEVAVPVPGAFQVYPAASEAPDIARPVVTYVDPLPGATLAPADSVTVDVTDDSGLFARKLLAVAFADGTQELAYDGQSFAARYLGASTVATITDGQRFVLRRTGGWPGAEITVRSFVVDAAGNTES